MPRLIESYEFGEMVINGKRYTSDVIVFREKTIDGWWRKEGHKLHIEDLAEIFRYKPKPEVLVLGTGYHGLVKVPGEVKDALESRGIELYAQPTGKAYQTFNKFLESDKQIAGAFHLTC